MRKASRAMDAAFALEVLDKAPYITVSFVRPDGTPYGVPLSLARTDPNVVSKSYGNYVGLLLFSFRLATGNHELASFNGDYVNVGQYYNGAWADGIDFNYTYTLKEQGYPGWGKFNLVENLPDISQIDFIKSICQMFGLFVVAGTGDNVKFVRFSELCTLRVTVGEKYDFFHRQFEFIRCRNICVKIFAPSWFKCVIS